MKLIVEMAIPKDCPMCPMAHYNKLDKFTGCEVAAGKLFAAMRDKEYAESTCRPSWCPIKGVLPKQHGDLIDRDELFETIKSRVALVDSCPEGKPSMKELFERDVLCTCLHDVVCEKAVIEEERKDDEQIH